MARPRPRPPAKRTRSASRTKVTHAERAARASTATSEPAPPVPAGVRAAAKEETRAALIDAGIALIREQGLDAPSLDAICARAGRTRGAFYVHFADRDDFLVAVMDSVGRGFLDAVFPADESPGAQGEDLAHTVARFVASLVAGTYPLMREGGVRPHQLLDACARSPQIRARYLALVQDSIARLAVRVQAAQRGGGVRHDVDAAQLSTILLATVIGAHTLLDLGAPLEVGAAAGTLLAVLAPSAAHPPRRGRR